MAEPSSVAEQALKKVTDQLTCAICLEDYKDPKLLQCFHVYCKECLERIVLRDQQGLSLRCPSCCKSTLLPPNSISGLQSAFYVNHLFEIRDTLKKVEDSQETQCEKCREYDAINFCRDCGQFICKTCSRIHQTWAELSTHEVISFDQLEGDVTQLVPLSKKVTYCFKHPTKLKESDLYCETCEELICRDCIIRVHRDHQYDLVTDAYPKHKDVIVDHLQPIKQQLGAINEAIECLDTRQQQIVNQRMEIEANIHKSIQQIREVLEERKTELIGQLDQLTQQKIKSLAAQRDEFELVQTRLSSCLNFVSESLRTGSQAEILAAKKPVVQQIKEMTAEFKPESLEPAEQADMKFTTTTELAPACNQFGKVYTNPVFPKKCHATGKGPEVAKVGEQTTTTVHAVDTEGQENRATTDRKPIILTLNLRGSTSDQDLQEPVRGDQQRKSLSTPGKRRRQAEDGSRCVRQKKGKPCLPHSVSDSASPGQGSSPNTQVEPPRFGQQVEVLFDDGDWYPGVIIGKNPKTKKWITRFEDGTEDCVENPATHPDYRLLN